MCFNRKFVDLAYAYHSLMHDRSVVLSRFLPELVLSTLKRSIISLCAMCTMSDLRACNVNEILNTTINLCINFRHRITLNLTFLFQLLITMHRAGACSNINLRQTFLNILCLE